MYIPTTTLTQGGGSFHLIADSTLGVAGTFDFTSIPGTYKHLRVIALLRGANASATVVGDLRFNNDSAANYYGHQLEAFGTSFTSSQSLGVTAAILGNIVGNSGTAGRCSTLEILIPDYAGTTFHKTFHSHSYGSVDTGGGNQYTDTNGAVWASTAAITSITLFPATGTNWVAGSRASLYGIG